MQKTNLTESEKNEIIEWIKQGSPLLKESIYKLYDDDEDVFLFWNGRSETVTNAVLPFHSIEHIDEPRKERLFSPADSGAQISARQKSRALCACGSAFCACHQNPGGRGV